jgi:hypothetical protein
MAASSALELQLLLGLKLSTCLFPLPEVILNYNPYHSPTAQQSQWTFAARFLRSSTGAVSNGALGTLR